MIPKAATRILESGAPIIRQSGVGKLLIVKGPDRGESIVIGEVSFTIGSSSECDVPVSDPTVSRRHLGVEPGPAGIVLRDLGSTNGSFVQGARFHELTLGFGTEITIGKTVLKYVPNEEAVELDPSESENYGTLVARDARLRSLFRLLADISMTDATVLIEGESGTGKALFAEEIHRHSTRKDGPFVVFCCDAVREEQAEAALFGQTRGGLAGAPGERRGAFQEAVGGTLFLDEIAALPLAVQPALLRALDKQGARPLGAGGPPRAPVRVIAATSQNLRAEIAAKKFREDLYYRIAVVRMMVPPLRDRPDDVPLLVEHFVRLLRPDRPLTVAPADLARLQRHFWLGNVRELRNVIERASALSRGPQLVLDEVLEEPPVATVEDSPNFELPFKNAKAQVVDRFERAYIEALLKRHEGNLSAAARAAEIDRKHLRELLRKHGLRATTE